MKISVILGHPYNGSFNTALAETACAELKELGHTVSYHDLHSENFNPVMPQRKLAGAQSGCSLSNSAAYHATEQKKVFI